MINPIIQHELRQVIFSRKAWICFAVLQAILALIFNWLVNKYLLNLTMLQDGKYGLTEEVIHPYYAWFCLLILFFIPMLTTQSICAEKSNNTIINYRCAPLTATQFILGKFLAMNIVLTVMLTVISILPLSVMLSGRLDWGQFGISILGAYLLLNAALAIGLGCSIFMTSVVRCNILVFFTLLLFISIEWTAQFTGNYAAFLQGFGLLVPLKSYLSGVLHLKHTAYYLLLIMTALFLAAWRYQRGDKNV